jgi:hypothetical protein
MAGIKALKSGVAYKNDSQGGNSKSISDIPEGSKKAPDGVGLAADFHSVPITAATLITEVGSHASKMLSRSGTVVGTGGLLLSFLKWMKHGIS